MSPADDCHGCDICDRCEREIQWADGARASAILAVCEFLDREGYEISAREVRQFFGVERVESAETTSKEAKR